MSMSLHSLPVSNRYFSQPVCLVAGGAGFIGSSLCQELLTLKTRVICLDSLENGKKDRLSRWQNQSGFSFIKQDFSQPISLIDEKIDYIFHLANLENNLEKRQLEAKDLLVGSIGTKNLLDLALQNKAKFLLGSPLNDFFSLPSQGLLGEKLSPFLSHNEAKRYGEALMIEYFQKHHQNCRLVQITDVFGPLMNLSVNNEITKLFSAFVFNQELKIEGEGLKTIYPTFINDLIKGLIKAMFKNETNGKVFNLIGEKTTLISLALMMQKIKPALKIVSVKTKTELNLTVNGAELTKTAKEIAFSNQPLNLSLKTMADFYQPPIINLNQNKEKQLAAAANQFLPVNTNKTPKLSAAPTIPAKEGKGKVKKKLHFRFNIKLAIFMSFFIGLLLLFYPVISLFWHGYFGFNQLKQVEKSRPVENIDQTIGLLEKAQNNLQTAYIRLDQLSWFFNLINKKETQEKYLKTLTIGQNLSEGAKHLYLAGQNLSRLFKAVTGEENEDLTLNTTRIKLEVGQSQESFSLVIAQLKDLREKQMNQFPIFQKLLGLKKYEEKLSVLKNNLNQIDNLITVLPDFLAENNRKTYLVLLQNNMELRPTGGFIGSYGLLTFEEGKMVDFKIEDVYSADGQLKGRVAPPDEILHYLGQPNWFLRDSNFSPNFPISSQRAQWFFEKETGALVDGVIGVDLSLAKKMVLAVGSLDLPDYKEKITEKNLFTKTEYQAEIDFFPGSKQKKNFLTSLYRALFDKLIHASEKDTLAIAMALAESLKEKHLAFYFTDPILQSTFSRENFSGEIVTFDPQPIIGENNDYFMLTEANFGANKANYFISRQIKQEINLGKLNEITEKVTLIYKNSSPADSWPGGNYKNYLRIIVPNEASFINADINENKKPKLISALTEEELKKLAADQFLVIESTESGKKSWGTLIEVPVGKTKTISFSWQLKKEMSFDENNLGSYRLYVQKQMGTDNDSYQLRFGFPAYMKVSEIGEGVEKAQLIEYNTTLLTDKEFIVQLIK